MKSTTNVFQEGLRTDLHPLSTGQQYLTDALNATMITYNGNEMMLQNDMGNTRIQDSATGNIMSLSPGFIPVGMKEHGGIMYIASVNKDGQGEIGTIPSPIIRDIYKDKVSFRFQDGQAIPVNTGDPVQISNKLYPADKFIVNLQMEIEESENNKIQGAEVFRKVSDLSFSNSSDPSDFILKRRVAYKSGYTDIYTPLISYAPDFTNSSVSLHGVEGSIDLFSTKGIYKMSLLSTNTNGQKVEDSLTNCQVYGDSGNRSKYWFTHSNSISNIFPKDLLMATLNSDLKQFPSSNKPGRLAVKLETESVGKFDILPRKDGLTVPITFKESTNYTTYFPGFYYSTDSGLYIDKLSNIKVIDESTNGDILHNTSSVEFKNYKLEGITNPATIDENEEYIEVWQYEQLPQTKTSDGENPNTFILSNIKSITNHTKTNLRSSTKGMDESPHTGIIQVDLGEKYNNWYRLELDYYDQYGEKQGVFTKRFNPYINDVFGTNLGLDPKNFEYGNPCGIGYSQTITDTVLVNKTLPEIICTYSASLHKSYEFSLQWKNEPFNEGRGCVNIPGDTTFKLSGIQFKDQPESTQDWAIYDCVPHSYNIMSRQLGKDYQYMYTIPEFKYTSELQKSVKYCDISGGYASQYGSPELLVFESSPIGDDTGFMVSDSDFYSEDVKFAERQGSFKIIWSDTTSANFPRLVEPLTNAEQMPKSSLLELNAEFFTIHTNRVQITPEANQTLVMQISDLWGKSPNGSPLDLNEVRFQYAVPTKNDNSEKQCNIKIGITSSLSKIKSSGQADSVYSIIPYFCLKGISDDSKTVYVQRFGKETGIDIVYQHNFEYAGDQPKNYFSTNEDLKSSQLTQCSYNHQVKFNYYSEMIDFSSDELSPGIYVLNVSRVPGPAIDGDDFNKDSYLTIEIGNNEVVYNTWCVNPDYENGVSNSSIAETTHSLLFRPLVLIIPTSTILTIKSSENNFYRQNIGLFKINEVDSEESITELQNTIPYFKDVQVIPYDDYMYELIHYAYSLTQIEQYTFMQKYGVFFKEAYVFIDGLINSNNQIREVTIGKKTYGSYPFIPCDPSILPVHLSTEGDYSWNAYIMPEAILNVIEYPNFVFSNPLNDAYTTEPGEGNLRRRVEQQN